MSSQTPIANEFDFIKQRLAEIEQEKRKMLEQTPEPSLTDVKLDVEAIYEAAYGTAALRPQCIVCCDVGWKFSIIAGKAVTCIVCANPNNLPKP